MQKKVQKSWKVSENWATINQLSWTKCKLSYYVFRYRTDVMLTSSELSFPTFFLHRHHHPQKSSPAYHTIFGHFLHRKCNLIEKSNFFFKCSSKWGKIPQFIQKITCSKSLIPRNSHFQNRIFSKNSHFKITFWTKIGFSKSRFSQKSPFRSQFFTKITFSKVAFLTKITF